uniref:Uncharacterized protein n=1 Tax=Mycena chlorophos TaxID=658473 RepID=A0ABQ0LJI0_MYCCL|nr:predicted protein [Mycena chlorophos]
MPRKPDFVVQGPPADPALVSAVTQPHTTALVLRLSHPLPSPGDSQRSAYGPSTVLSVRAQPPPARFGAVRWHLPVTARPPQTTANYLLRRLRTIRAVKHALSTTTNSKKRPAAAKVDTRIDPGRRDGAGDDLGLNEVSRHPSRNGKAARRP